MKKITAIAAMMLMVGSAAVSCNGAKKQADNTEAQDSTFVTPLHVEGLYLLNAKGAQRGLPSGRQGRHNGAERTIAGVAL